MRLPLLSIALHRLSSLFSHETFTPSPTLPPLSAALPSLTSLTLDTLTISIRALAAVLGVKLPRDITRGRRERVFYDEGAIQRVWGGGGSSSSSPGLPSLTSLNLLRGTAITLPPRCSQPRHCLHILARLPSLRALRIPHVRLCYLLDSSPRPAFLRGLPQLTHLEYGPVCLPSSEAKAQLLGAVGAMTRLTSLALLLSRTCLSAAQLRHVAHSCGQLQHLGLGVGVCDWQDTSGGSIIEALQQFPSLTSLDFQSFPRGAIPASAQLPHLRTLTVSHLWVDQVPWVLAQPQLRSLRVGWLLVDDLVREGRRGWQARAQLKARFGQHWELSGGCLS